MGTYIFRIKETGYGVVRIAAPTQAKAEEQYDSYLAAGMYQADDESYDYELLEVIKRSESDN